MSDDDHALPRPTPELPIPLALWGVFPWVPPYKAGIPMPISLPPPPRAHKPRIDITGERHGALVASHYDAERGRGYWYWSCDCDGLVTRTSDAVRRADGPRDCGCGLGRALPSEAAP